MTDHTDQDAREARQWAEHITSVRELHGDYAPQARAAARFILDNTDSPLPDPLFGARATHPDYGEGIVISHYPDEEGEVRFVIPDQETVDGTWTRWMKPSELTFHTPDMSKNEAEIDTSTEHVDGIDTRPDHPEFLKTEEDYRSAPAGTIVAHDEDSPFVLIYGLWRNPNPWKGDHGDMAGRRRRVLRWRWEA